MSFYELKMHLFVNLSPVPEPQACSARDVILIVTLPVLIKLIITSALLGNLV